MAQHGAQVMQTRAVELGWVNDVVIEVLSSFEDAPGDADQGGPVRGAAQQGPRPRPRPQRRQGHGRRGARTGRASPTRSSRRWRTQGISVDIIVQNVSHGGTTDMSVHGAARPTSAKARRILEPIARELDAREITTDASVAKVSIVGAGITNAPGYAARMFGALADAGVNIEAIATSEIRITCLIGEDGVEPALRSLHEAFELERPDDLEVASTARGATPGAAAS